MTTQAQSVEQIQQFVHDHTSITMQGGGSKMTAPTANSHLLDLSQLSGIIEYEPGEFTFTAYAGTRVADVMQELDKNGQYLPFDPMFSADGATLGGTVCANTSGSGRYRYGGVRDFILGVKFVDGTGRVVSGGGKVVKNAAGFDIPKLFVGSLGTYGTLTSVTFKVFPRPEKYLTLSCLYPDRDAALNTWQSTHFMELDALDIEPEDDGKWTLMLRISGNTETLKDRTRRIQDTLNTNTSVLRINVIDDDITLWASFNACAWADSAATIVKIPIAVGQLPALDNCLNETRRYTAGGNIAWVATTDVNDLEDVLKSQNLVGLCMRGDGTMRVLGKQTVHSLANRVKQVLDPHGKFREI